MPVTDVSDFLINSGHAWWNFEFLSGRAAYDDDPAFEAALAVYREAK